MNNICYGNLFDMWQGNVSFLRYTRHMNYITML